MRIVIDGRPLMWHIGGGVPVFTQNTIKSLALRGDHDYVLWQNAWKTLPVGKLPPHVVHTQTHLPNKILNPLLMVSGRPRLDALGGDADVFFLPNLNFVSRPRRGKVVVTVHDLSFVRAPHFFSMKQQLWHRALNVQKLFQMVDRIVAVSEHTKDDLLELFPHISKEKVSVIGLGIEAPSISGLQLNAVRAAYQLNHPYILHVGTLEPRKNLVNLMRAFAGIAQSGAIPECDLVLVGAKAWGANEVLREHQKSPVKERIKILGSISDVDKHAIMAGAKLFVYPSWYEGFGIPPLEAARHGIPVIASSTTAMPETLGKSALLVNPWDVAGLGQAIVALLTDDILRGTYALRAHDVSQKYQWSDVADRLVKVFET